MVHFRPFSRAAPSPILLAIDRLNPPMVYKQLHPRQSPFAIRVWDKYIIPAYGDGLCHRQDER